jgi:phospholipid-binding lipoprotein MlaA
MTQISLLRRRARSALLAISMSLLVSGCATRGQTTTYDPIEGFNRGVYKVNDVLDRAAAKPVAKAYKAITPNFVRQGVSNFFDNLSYPTTLANDLLQLKLVDTLKDTGRLLVNTTIGIGGLFDVATKIGLPPNDEDFGQTLAKWGVPAGPFIYLPLFGPSSLRDAPSRVVDFFFSPLQYVDIDSGAEIGVRALDLVDTRTNLLALDGQLERVFDKYAFQRDAWVQNRQFAVFDGNPPEPPEPEYEDYEDNGTPEADDTMADPAATPAPGK